MKIPKQLKIGGHLYRIEFVKEDEISTNHQCGQTNRTKGKIIINANLVQSEKECTLIHEIFHVINNEMNEAISESLSQQLYQVLKDNELLK